MYDNHPREMILLSLIWFLRERAILKKFFKMFELFKYIRD